MGIYPKIILSVFILLIMIVGGFLVFNLLGHKNSNLEIIQPKKIIQTAVVGTSTAPAALPMPLGDTQFVIALNATTTDDIAENLFQAGFVATTSDFVSAFNSSGSNAIEPGAYMLSTKMTPNQIVQVLDGNPYMKWVVIPEGLRKEEIAALLAETLGWTKAEENEWINVDTTSNPDYVEGVYFPDTYLIPVNEKPADTAKRLIAMFNEKFAPLLPQFAAQNVKWTTALTLASIVQREASGDADMPLIAGILWNRLNNNMYLDVDSTLQYARGNTGSGWWAPIKASDEQIDSPFNSYTNKGLPPHPISNPGLPAIEAVLNPTQTDCLYYIHDSNHITHCAATLEEQDANIKQYLINQ